MEDNSQNIESMNELDRQANHLQDGENLKSWKTDQQIEAEIEANAEASSTGNGQSMAGAGPQGT